MKNVFEKTFLQKSTALKKWRVISHLLINAWDIVYELWVGQSRQVSGLQAPGPWP
jgi:hypothetical protein